MDKEIMRPGIVLFIITAVVSMCLGVVNSMTAPVIAENNIISKNQAMSEVLAGVTDSNFSDEILTGDTTGVISCSTGYAGADVYGYAVSVKVKGYGGTIEVMVGVKADGTVEGVRIISHDETAGLGANASSEKFTGQYSGKKGALSVTKSASPSENEIQAITSATITSKAVTEGVNFATEYVNTNFNEGGAK